MVITQIAFQFMIFFGISLSQKLPNIQYLGSGYNILIANPQPTNDIPSDPGFTLWVADLTYNGNSKTPDGKYDIPDNVDVWAQSGSCTFMTTSQYISGDQSYSNYLSQEMSISGGESGWFQSVSFSANEEYQQFHEQTYSYSNTYNQARAICLSYEAQLKPFFNVTSDFSTYVGILPNTVNVNDPNDPYFQFINYYGMFYTESISMGARYIIKYEFNQQSWESLYWSDINIQEAANVNFAIMTGSASWATQQQIEQSQTYASASSATYISTIGQSPPNNGNITEWMQLSIEYPAPVTYSLQSISNLFSSIYFPNINSSILEIKKNNLLTAFDYSCIHTPNCQQYMNDLSVVNSIQEAKEIVGTQTVSCPVGYDFISCGYQSLSSNAEIYWGVWPTENGCTCYNGVPGGAMCYAICVPNEFVLNKKIISKSASGGSTTTLSCDNNQLITGCGIQHTEANTNFNTAREIYPSKNNSCTCYDPGYYYCYAICMDNVYQSKIYSNGAFNGNLLVSCEGEPIVLGCGINANMQSYKGSVAIYASGYNSCVGSYNARFDVVTLCGNLKSNTTGIFLNNTNINIAKIKL